MTKKPNPIEIVEISQSYGKLRVHARFNYDDGSWQEFIWKTSPQRSDEEIQDILERKFEQMKPEKIQQVRESAKSRETRLKERMKKFKPK